MPLMRQVRLIMPLAIIFSMVYSCISYLKADDLTKISISLGLDLTSATVVTCSDTHGGFHGDGLLYMEMNLDEEPLETAIQYHDLWKPLPLSENLQAFVYGQHNGGTFIGPYLDDEEGNPLVPPIANGYYYFKDRYDESTNIYDDSKLFGRYSYNLTLSIYDMDTNTLYYCEFDT